MSEEEGDSKQSLFPFYIRVEIIFYNEQKTRGGTKTMLNENELVYLTDGTVMTYKEYKEHVANK